MRWVQAQSPFWCTVTFEKCYLSVRNLKEKKNSIYIEIKSFSDRTVDVRMIKLYHTSLKRISRKTLPLMFILIVIVAF
jgi:hypothetical protein